MQKGATLWRFPARMSRWFPIGKSRLRVLAMRLGQRGEEAAREFLEDAGYEILCRNWRAPRNLGELDIVCRDDAGTLCVVEVKTRRWRKAEEPMPHPVFAVNPEKRRRLRRTVSAYLGALGNPAIPLRYDAIEVWANVQGQPVMLRHWPDLFAGISRYSLQSFH